MDTLNTKGILHGWCRYTVKAGRFVLTGIIITLVSGNAHSQDHNGSYSINPFSDSTGFFRTGTTNVKLPNGNSYASDTLGRVCSMAELGTYGGWIKSSHPSTGFFYAKQTEGNWHLVDPEGYEFIAMSVVSVEKGGPVNLPGDLEWNMINSMGNWSDLSITDIPVCPRYTFLQNFKNSSSSLKDLFDRDILPVFDPGYGTFCDAQASLFVSEFRNDPWVIGYFTDNELTFHKVTLDDYLGLDKENANYIAAHNWMVGRHGEGYTVTDSDRDAFRGYVAASYAEPVYDAIRKYDPSHMILGPRLHASGKYDPYILEGLGSFVDVLGINFYSRWEPDQASMDLWLEKSGKPFLITEFYTKGMDTGLPNNSGAGWEVYTQQDRAWFFENFALTLMSHPGSVGWQWFRYIDKDGVNKGVISETYQWYSELLASMRKVGKDVYNLRRFLLGLEYDPVWDPECGDLGAGEIIRGSDGFMVLPNPSSGKIRIKAQNSASEKIVVSLYNLLAQEVFRSVYPPLLSGSFLYIDVDLHGLEPGYYTVQIKTGVSVDRTMILLL